MITTGIYEFGLKSSPAFHFTWMFMAMLLGGVGSLWVEEKMWKPWNRGKFGRNNSTIRIRNISTIPENFRMFHLLSQITYRTWGLLENL